MEIKNSEMSYRLEDLIMEQQLMVHDLKMYFDYEKTKEYGAVLLT